MTEVEQREPFTEEEAEVAFAAWALAARGKSFVPTDEYLPAAESMRARGWLSSGVLDNGDTAYEWTPAGETALETSELVRKRAAETN